MLLLFEHYGFRLGDDSAQLPVAALDLVLGNLHQLDAEGEPEDPADQVVLPDTPALGRHVLLRIGPPLLIMAHLISGNIFHDTTVLGRPDRRRQPGVDVMLSDLTSLIGQQLAPDVLAEVHSPAFLHLFCRACAGAVSPSTTGAVRSGGVMPGGNSMIRMLRKWMGAPSDSRQI